MTTLPEFLLARIAEDEAVAIETRDSHDPLIWTPDDYGDSGAWGMGGPVDGPSGYGSIVITPARVLAECEAKRRIVEIHSADHECSAPGDGYAGVFAADGTMPSACVTMRALALPYADHEQFQEEWRV